jgi:protein TonB
VAGIDVARHGLDLARFGVAGVGALSTVRPVDPRPGDRRGRVRRWPAAAFVVSLLAHGVAVMLLLPIRSQPLSVASEKSFQLVFEPPVKAVPSVEEPLIQQPPAPPAVVREVPRATDPEAVLTGPSPAPEAEPQEPSPAAPALAEEKPPAKSPAPQAMAPKASSVARPAVRHAAPPQRSAEPLRAPGEARAVTPPEAAGPFVPPSPLAGMATNRAPAYPQSALRRGEQGNVMLRVSVTADGVPLAVDLAATSGYASLDSAAEAAVRRWRFNPATRAGIAVAAIAEVPVRFQLAN